MAKAPIKSFVPDGYYCINSSLIEVQFNNTNEMVRYRITTFHYAKDIKVVYYGYWQPIRYNRAGRAYLKDWHGNKSSGKPSRKHRPLFLDNFMSSK